jgi:ligand-binding sensor domain-containing protein
MYWITSIVIDTVNNKKWFGTSRGLVCFDGKNWQLFTTQNSQIINNCILNIARDNKGSLWIATLGYGVSIFDGKNWRNVNNENSLLTDRAAVDGIFFDNKGRPWIIDSQNQTYIYDENWKHLSLYSNQTIQTLLFDKFDNLWIGTFIGLGKFSDTKSVNKYVKVEMVNNLKKEFDYNAYIPMQVNYFNSTNSNIPNSDIRCMVIDKNNNLWIGTGGGGIAYYKLIE